jgi:hypothetical protein
VLKCRKRSIIKDLTAGRKPEMKEIRSFSYIEPYTSRVFDEYFGDLDVLIIDIETTGLYPNSSKIILGGLLSRDERKHEAVQFFADKKDDEKELLAAYGKALSYADVLITYNGGGFDLPFLKYRFKKNLLPFDLDLIQSFDLYRALRYYSKMRDILPNLKQKSIEAFLELSSKREDDISGGESVELYKQYLERGSKINEDKILLHNRDDLIQLASIIKILDKLDLHRILFHEGFTVANRGKKALITNISLSKKHLTVTAKTRNACSDYYSFETGYQAVHRAASKELSLTVPYESKYGADIIDLESFNIDFSQIEKYPAYESGYLILREKDKTSYAEINKIVKIILSEILASLMI